MIRLVIKGLPKDAQYAANFRGIAVANVKQNANRFETFATCPLEQEAEIHHWFREIERPPMPVGALLHFVIDRRPLVQLDMSAIEHSTVERLLTEGLPR